VVRSVPGESAALRPGAERADRAGRHLGDPAAVDAALVELLGHLEGEEARCARCNRGDGARHREGGGAS